MKQVSEEYICQRDNSILMINSVSVFIAFALQYYSSASDGQVFTERFTSKSQ